VRFEFTIDGGAYETLSPVVLSRGAIHAGGPYYWPSVRIRATAVATNTPPHGAFRGFGAPQSLFALERHMDRIAKVLGVSSVEIRRRNFLRPGQTTTTGQTVQEEIDLEKLLDRALEVSDYHPKKKIRHRKPTGTQQEGNGIAAFLHGAGFYRFGRALSRIGVGLEACADGSVRVLGLKHGIWTGDEHPCSARSRRKHSGCGMKTLESPSQIRSRCE